jgi:hypothetical protein
VSSAKGASDEGGGVTMEAYFHSGSNENIDGRVQLWWPELSLIHHIRLYTLTSTCRGRGGD